MRKMSRCLIAFVSVAIICFAVVSANAASSGTCGENLTWTLSNQGVLTIAGNGAMYDYTGSDTPWYSSRNDITSVTFTGQISSIGNYAFFNCSNMTRISMTYLSIKSIGNYAFANCSALNSAGNVLESATSLGDHAFYGCSGLSRISLHSMTNIGPYAFANCTSLTSVSIPEATVGHHAFYNCNNLTDITISYGITEIANYTFSYCSKLTSVVIPRSVTSIGAYAFQACNALESITIPESVISIGTNAFGSCNNVVISGYSGSAAETYAINNNIAFSEASTVAEGEYGSLTWKIDSSKKLTISGSGSIPKSDSPYPWNSYMNRVESLVIEEGVTGIRGPFHYYTGSYWSNESFLKTVTLPESLTSIAESTFSECRGLTRINLPSGLTNIPANTFYGCSSLKSIAIPESVVIIHPNAFSSSGLTEVTLPEGIRIIGEQAFANCRSLTAFSIDENNQYFTVVDGILYNKGKTELICCPAGRTSAPEIEPTVTRIGNYAFSGFRNFGSGFAYTAIPDTITSIGNRAFENAGGYLLIPDSVTVFGENVLSQYSGGIFCDVDSAAAEYISRQGGGFGAVEYLYSMNRYVQFQILFGSNGERTGVALLIAPYDAETFDIPNYVTCIEDGAFYNRIRNVTIPESVTQIMSYAFSDCTSLSSICIPASVDSIGDYAFSGCTGLTSAQIGSGKIGKYAFSECSNLVNIEIEPGVRTIDNYAFSNCTSLISITLPDSVTSIGGYAFKGCSNLTDVFLPAEITNIGYQPNNATFHVAKNSYAEGWAIENNKSYVTYNSSQYSCGENVTWSLSQAGVLTISGTGPMTSHPWNMGSVNRVVIGNGVTSICDYAFYNCQSLEQVTIPYSVVSIGESAFEGCTGLSGITLPGNLNNIGIRAFVGCSNLSGISIPNSVTSIGICAFGDCRSLTSITIPAGITSIEGSTFSNCSGLTDITIPAGVTSIGQSAFYNCTGLTSITIPAGVTIIGNSAFSYCDGLTSITIPAGITSIGQNAFDNCSSLTSITIPSEVTRIGNSAFSGCSGLTEIIIPAGVTQIGYRAFNYCSSLTQVTILGDPTIGNNAFSNIGSECVFHVFGGGKAETWAISNSVNYVLLDGTLSLRCGENATYSINENGLLTICGSGPMYDYDYNGQNPWGIEVSSVVIQPGITSIGDYAFYDCSNLTSISIPESIISIGDYAFFGCSNLTSISIPESIISIGDYAFSGCSNLTSISIPQNVSSIGEYAFSFCKNLTSVNIPEGISVIKNGTFSWCSSLLTIIIPTNVTEISAYAFHGCNNLTSIVIPSSVTSIGNGAFTDCSALTGITFPNTITSIGDGVLRDCSSLTSFSIPTSVTRIGENAFSGCTGLTGLIIPNSVLSIGNNAFSNCSNLQTISTYCTGLIIDLEELYAYGLPFAERTTIQAIHADIAPMEEVAPTCTSAGLIGGSFCNACGTIVTEQEETEPLGHEWTETTYTWNADNSKVTATRFCTRDASHMETEEVTVTPEITKAATCEDKGETTYTSTEFTNSSFAVQAKTVDDIPALGHDWSTPTYTWNADNSCVTASRICGHDSSHVEAETVDATSKVTKPATCEAKGETTYTGATFENTAFTVQAKTIDNVPALGHDWGAPKYEWNADNSKVTATRICTHDESHFEAETVNTTVETVKAETCESKGETKYTASFSNTAFTSQIKTIDNIPALGHAWLDTTYEWTTDNSMVTATRICARDASHNETETVPTVSEQIAATCEETGGTTYFATFTNHAFVMQTKNVNIIPALGHLWGEVKYTWSGDHTALTASRVCSRDAEHVDTENVSVTAVVTKEATYTEMGETTYTSASFTNPAFEQQILTLADIPMKQYETCGDNVWWLLEDGILTIWGQGDIVANPKPWPETDVVQVVIESGVTGIGEYAFENCTNLTDISIPDTMIRIGQCAFHECNSLTGIMIPYGVTEIEAASFAGCSSMTNISIPNSVTSIARDALSGCSSLTSITLPDSLTTIGYGAFWNCTGLARLKIPENVTGIGNIAFGICSNLTRIDIPVSVTTFGNDVFTGCTSLKIYGASPSTAKTYADQHNIAFVATSGTCGSNLTWVLDDEGVLMISGSGTMNDYDYDGAPWTAVRSSIQSVVIDEGVTSIGVYAFLGCSNLTSISIPSNLTSINNCAFEGCGFTTLAIPDTVLEIGDWAFARCASLTEIKLPNGLSSLGSCLFNYCSSLTDIIIPDSVVSIGGWAFGNCSSLTEITVPNLVTKIEDWAFGNCDNLSSIALPNNLSTISSNSIPSTAQIICHANSNTAKRIAGLFSNARIISPGAPDYMWTFIDYESDTCIYISGYVGSTKDVVIPSTIDGVTVIAIGNDSFKNNTYVQSVSIPDSARWIGGSAFYGCSNLERVNIGASIHDIWENAFYGCSSLITIDIPESCIRVAEYVFAGCDSLKVINIPDTVTILYDQAFYNCSGVEEIRLPSYLTELPTNMFTGCTNLKRIIYPDNLTKLTTGSVPSGVIPVCHANGNTATLISNTGDLMKIQSPSTTGFLWDKTSNGELYLTGYNGPSGLVSVPDSIDNLSVVCIANNAFENVTGVTSVALPESVLWIGGYGFYGCSDLETIQLTKNLDAIWEYAFAGCSKLQSIEVPEGVETLSNYAFSQCTSLKTVSLPSTLTGIGSNIFNNCSSLESISISCSSFDRIRACFANDTQYIKNHGEVVTDEAVEPTCITLGNTEGSHCAICNDIITAQETIPAIGHDWAAADYVWSTDNSQMTATRNCSHDATHVETETVNVVAEVTKAATCEAKGETTYSAHFTNTAFEDQIKVLENVDALGHDWDIPTYVWVNDYRRITARRACKNDPSHVETENTDTYRELIAAPTETEAGSYQIVSNAFDNPAFAVQTKADLVIPALGSLNVLKLPSFLTTIETEAFDGIAAQAIIVSETCTTIQSRAFVNCDHLLYVCIPAGVQIPDDAFAGCPNVVIDQR